MRHVTLAEPPPEARASEAEALRFLANATDALASTLDYQATLETVAELPLPFLADWCIVDEVDEDGSLRRVAVAAR